MGLQKIKMNVSGEIKEVSDHLAFDTSLQKSVNFYPCDDQGIPVNTPDGFKEPEKKSTPLAAAGVDDMKEAVIIPPAEGGESFAEKIENAAGEVEAKILALNKEGKAVKEIAKEVGRHWKQVEKVINDSK